MPSTAQILILLLALAIPWLGGYWWLCALEAKATPHAGDTARRLGYGLFMGGATSWWAVCRVHNGGSNLLFGDGHVKWMRPDEYHSNTESIDASGNPIPASPTPVDEATWRHFWDVAYDG